MNRVGVTTPEEVLVMALGWGVVSALLVVGWARMRASRITRRRMLQDIRDLESARQLARLERERVARDGQR